MTNDVLTEAMQEMRIVVDEILSGSGDLTDKEVNKKLPNYVQKAEGYARKWHRKLNRVIDYEDLFSPALEGAWEALRTFKHDGGRSEHSWVCKGIWLAIKRESRRHFSHRRRYTNFGETPILDITAGSYGLDICAHEEKQLAKRLVGIALHRLDPRDAEILNAIFLKELSQVDYAKDSGVTHQAISLRAKVVINKIRAILIEYPEFRGMDENSRLIQPKTKSPEFKYARLKIHGSDDFQWVSIAG
jgi:RNA polymerase sigma factor (sigma-70 family)